MTRDVMRVLAEARPEEFDGTVDETTRSAELARAMTAPAPRTATVPARRRIRPMWGLGLVGAAAAAALVVATTATGPGGGDPKAGGTPSGPVSTEPVTMNARTVLLAAASGADKEATASGAYWHSTTVTRSNHWVGTKANGYLILVQEKSEGWTPSRPGAKIYGRQPHLGARPATPADLEAWRRAGSPSTFKVGIPVSPDLGAVKGATFVAAPGRATTSSDRQLDGDKIFWLGRNVSMKDLRGLPADPKRLKAELLRWYGGHDTETTSVPMSADDWLLRVAGGMITDMPVTPKVRAAAFRMLAQLKSIKAVGPVKDGQGRVGTALVSFERTRNGVLEHRLIIDEARGRALGKEIIIRKPGGVNANLPAGALLTATTIDDDWTDTTPR